MTPDFHLDFAAAWYRLVDNQEHPPLPFQFPQNRLQLVQLEELHRLRALAYPLVDIHISLQSRLF